MTSSTIQLINAAAGCLAGFEEWASTVLRVEQCEKLTLYVPKTL